MRNIREYYLNKETRDNRFKELKKQGLKVKKSSSRNQLLHPMYIEDFNGPEKLDTGFGNTVYKTHFDVIYKIENAGLLRD